MIGGRYINEWNMRDVLSSLTDKHDIAIGREKIAHCRAESGQFIFINILCRVAYILKI